MSENLRNASLARVTLLATIMVLSIVTMSVAFTGSTAATVDSADRNIDKTEVPNGSLVTITINASFDEMTDAQINERIVPNLSAEYVEITDSSGATIAEYQESTGTVSVTYLGVESTTLTYEIVVPSDEPVGTTYNFSDGRVKDTTDDTVSMIAGDETIEVIDGESDYTPPDDGTDDGAGGVTSAERLIESSEALPGETVTVTTSVSFDGTTADARVNDVIDPALPTGNVEVTDDDGATISSYQESSGTLTGSWGGVDSVTLEYDVTIPDDASVGATYGFSGEAEDGEVSDVSTITGNETIEVVDDPIVGYTNSEGIVGPAGLGDAAADFRAGDIGPAVLGDVASAFRSGNPVV